MSGTIKNENIIAVQFYLNEEDEIISGHDYKVVDMLDEENYVVEVLVDKDKWNEIRVEARDHKGDWRTYEIEKMEWFREGKEIKYMVSIWNLVN